MTKRKGDSLGNPEKKTKRTCRYQDSWAKEFNFVSASKKGQEYVRCTACNIDVSVASGGRNDLTRHINSKIHNSNIQTVNSTQKINNSFFKPASYDPVARAEVYFAAFIAEHNLSFSVADHFTDLVKVMFPDSDIAKKFKCRRTKTTNIVTKALAPVAEKKVTKLCRENKFSVLMDESNDQGDKKCVAILVRVYDTDVFKVMTYFLAMPVCNIGTGENLFTCLQEVFTERSIPWQNMIGYSSDNAPVMIGANNSVLSRVREQQPNVVNIGCVCHIMSTCTQYAVKKLAMPVEEVLQDTFTHFQHSSKRRQILQDFREFTDTTTYKLVRHCSTRWLSLQTCVDRYLQQWPALEAYFTSHDDAEKRGSRVFRVVECLQDPLLALIFRFLSFILVPLNDFNTTFQNGDSMAGHMHSELVRVIRTFMAKFVKMETITAAADVTMVDFKMRTNQHDEELLAVGMKARGYLDNNDVNPQIKAQFFSKVRAFYVEMTEKMIAKFPLNDPVLKCLSFLRPEFRETTPASSVAQLACRLGMGNPDSVEEEFVDYQLMAIESLPAYEQGMSLDPYWVALEKHKTPLQKPRFPTLVPLAFAALSLPHSNADPERCFSTLKKIQRDDRENLSMNTIQSLLSLKMNMNTVCFKHNITSDMCAEARKVCNC